MTRVIRTNLHHLLQGAVAADAPALTYKGETVSYAGVWSGAQTAAAQFLELGLERGDRVAIYLEKRIETVLAIFAASAAGGIFVPINHVLKAPQVGHILVDSRARILVTSVDRFSQLTEMLRDTAIEHVIVIGASPSDAEGVAVHRWKAGDDAVGELPPSPAIDLDPAAILYTSGSTGKPKGVVLSHRNLIVGAESVSSYLNNTADDVIRRN